MINCRFSSFVVYLLFHFYLPKNLPREDETNTIVSLILKRVSTNSWESMNSISPFRVAVCRSPSSLWFCIDHRRKKLLGSEHRRSLFYFGLGSQYCRGWSSYWPKAPHWRNRLTFLAAESMTCPSSSNSPLLRSKPTNLSFVDQELSNGVFISARGYLQRNLGSGLTKRTVAWNFCQ